MERAWNVLLITVISIVVIFLGTLVVKATFSNKPTKRYRIETDTENGGYSGKALRYRIVEEKEYASNRYIVLADTCDITDAVRIQKELNAQLKVVK